jgi:hypothetical protein
VTGVQAMADFTKPCSDLTSHGPTAAIASAGSRIGDGAQGDKEMLGLDIGQIIELGTKVAMTGAIRAADLIADDVFEYIIGMAIVVYEIDPG